MKRILTGLIAAASIAAATLAAPSAAEARWGGWGWHGGWGWGPGPFIAGALVGGAIAGAYYYPYGYGYGPYPYGPCVWRTVWNGYRWVRACY
jgi:hypothetical protein